ncbi:MAG: clostripain-related cysteine peptidase, partial [Candidatus Thermoplasmatota archaeon]|nr:clostripain-related cysteine peptidase [Candidatus Thermoplasmatota archaeon]
MRSFRLFLYALVATVSLAITAAADDSYEDNDDSENAAIIVPGVYPGLSLEDDDWFSFDVNNHDLKVTAWYKENDALQLELWASGGSSAIVTSTGGEGEEQVAASGLTGTYYVRAVYVADTDYALALVAQPAGEPSWLFMLYLAGDNNLDSAGDEDIEEMAKIGSTENVWLLVLQDKWSTDDTSIQFVRSGEIDVLPLWVVNQTWGNEVDTGDFTVARDWAEWAIRAFSIDSKLMLDFWNHGGGIYGCCWDDNNNHNFLSYSELSTILQALSSSYGKLELVGFDACLMQMAETLVELGEYANFIVAAEETEPGDGWEYNYFLDDLVANPGMDGGELGEAIVVGYFELYGNSGGETLSVVNASYRAQITQLLDDFASKALDDGAIT